MSTIRIDRFLAEAQAATRQGSKELLKKGRVLVNGKAEKSGSRKIDPEKDLVTLDGVPVVWYEVEYWMLNKPDGVVSATEDSRDTCVTQLLTEAVRGDLFPVGRLDKDTEGLLLITNDGKLAHRLLSPKHHVDKTYYARIRGIVTEEDCSLFAQGIDIGDEKLCLPAKLVILALHPEEDSSEIQVTITEGRYHQVKRMFEAVGKEVVYLKRLTMGPIRLDPDLATGQARRLTPEEIAVLKLV